MSKRRCMRVARRVACYLAAIGMCPVLELKSYREHYRALHEAYSALPVDIRREARRRGRRLIHSVGLKKASTGLLPVPGTALPPRPARQTPWDALSAILRQSLGHCQHCQSRGRPKRAWPTRELAEAFRPLAGDMSLLAYECPYVRGSYHLGHIRESASSSVRESDTGEN
jgi:hypothetical protein